MLSTVDRRPFVLAAVGLLLAGIPLFAPTANAESPTGCPPSYDLRSVGDLAEAGNAPVPGQVDRAGNGDGYVCAHPLPDAVCFAKVHPDPCRVDTVDVYRNNNGEI